MDTQVRNRKTKKSNKSKQEKAIDCDESSDLKKYNRDSGDGASAPATPPPELSDDGLKNGNAKKTIKKTRQYNQQPLEVSFNFDLISVLLFTTAFVTRVWKISIPKAIVFDELHYAKYANLYVQNKFFFDSQPPLGKQILAFVGYLAGFDGDHKFERIGGPYEPGVPVMVLRLVPAFFGSLIMPTVYCLLTEIGVSSSAGILAALLLILDNALLIQSRYILMESFVIFFGLFGLLCVLRFRRYYSQPYSFGWFMYLILGSLSLSAAFCTRYFGGFTLLLGIGIIIHDFWQLVGDKMVSDFQLLIHCLVRAFVFITIPLTLYIGVFYIHLNTLYKAGPNDNIMTSAFQASLEGGLSSIVANQPLTVLHGSQITLRHTHGRTCWLHSHDAVYPVKYADDRGSSHQQQVTCYSYKDVNNWWIIKKPEIEELVVTEPHEPIKHGDVIEIVHGLTSRALNTHDVASSMSPHSQEVSCYIDYNISMPAQTLWKVHLLNKEATNGFWHALDSELRLIHVNTTAALKFAGRQLPEWGFRQHEIVADRMVEQEDTIWNVEEHRYSRTEDQKEREKELIQQEMIPTERRNLTFWEKLYELQYKMLFNNQENVAGHMYASDPFDWPFLKRGVAYWISPDSNAQIHFLGNVLIWICGTLSLIAYAALFGFYLLRRQRACYDLPKDAWDIFCRGGQVLVIGYLVHYIPYFLVDRTLFLHHYLFAYIFKICVLAFIVDHIYYLLAKRFNLKLFSYLYIIMIIGWVGCGCYVFIKFLPLSYGHVDLSADEIGNLTWRDSWDFIIHKAEV